MEKKIDEKTAKAFETGNVAELIREIDVGENGERVGKSPGEIETTCVKIRRFAGETPNEEIKTAIKNAVSELLNGDPYDVYCAALTACDFEYEAVHGRSGFGIDFEETIKTIEEKMETVFAKDAKTSVTWPTKVEHMRGETEAVLIYMKKNLKRIRQQG